MGRIEAQRWTVPGGAPPCKKDACDRGLWAVGAEWPGREPSHALVGRGTLLALRSASYNLRYANSILLATDWSAMTNSAQSTKRKYPGPSHAPTMMRTRRSWRPK